MLTMPSATTFAVTAPPVPGRLRRTPLAVSWLRLEDTYTPQGSFTTGRAGPGRPPKP
jgi:hypothetical protein